MEQKQRRGTEVHQSTVMKKNSHVRINSNFPYKKVALALRGNGTVIINQSPNENIKMKLKVRRRTKIKIRRA